MRIRVILGVFAALAVLAAVGVTVAVHHLSSSLPRPIVMQECTVRADGTVTLDPDQMANAATIAAVGITRGVPEQAVVIALATAAQESKLRNLEGGDRDSLGLFQQRPSQGWGRPEQIADPRYATGRFYTALLKVKGWQRMTLAQAAQRVQRSAYADAYEQWESEARTLATALLGNAVGAVACTITDQPARRGSAATTALRHDIALDWGRRLGSSRVTADAALGLQLTADNQQAGWQYAHWLVSHAADQGIKSVRFGNQQWSAQGGNWSTVPSSAPASPAGQVVARVYGDA